MAVYTTVDPPALAALLEAYPIGRPLRLEGILQGVENSNYSLETESGRYVLTLFERRAPEADLPYFLSLMEHLAAAGFPAPQPIRRRDGGLLSMGAGKPAAIGSFLSGDWPRQPTAADAAIAGAALARLHGAAGDFQGSRGNALGAADWRPLFARSAAEADRVRPGLAEAIASALDDILARWPKGLPAGACHLDLFPDNLFVADGRLSGVIDFYFAATEAYAYDLAIAMNAWCFDGAGRWQTDRAAALQAGYERVRPLEAAERAALPVLLEGAAMRFLLTRLFDWLFPAPGALVRPKDPLEQWAALAAHRSMRA